MIRKTLLAATLAAGALFSATTGSQAHYYGGGYGHYYGGYNYSYRYAQPTYNYYSCHTVSFQVWDDYSCTYVYRTKQICG